MRIFIILLTPFFLYAHSLSATSSYENSELFIESFFGDGTACKNCPFTVKYQEKVIYSNKLDKNGFFEEKVQIKTPCIVYIDGGMGHQAQVKIEEIKEQNNTQEKMTNEQNLAINSFDEEKLRKIIRSELKKQNIKIQAMIEKNKSTLEKMLIGLGYILGIFGIWQLFARKLQK